MTAYKIIAGVLLLLFLLGRIRLGGDVEYAEDGLAVKFRTGVFRFQVFPVKGEKVTRRKAAKGKSLEKTLPKPKLGGPLELVKQYLPLICEAAGELKRKIRIDKLYLDLTIATDNAAKTAMAYGYANMAMGMLWPVLEQNFEVKDSSFHTGVDFTDLSSKIYIFAALSARLGQLVSFGVRFSWKIFQVYVRNKPHGSNKIQKEAN